MKRVLYHLPDSNKKVFAFVLWNEGFGENSLLFVPPIEGVRGATLVIASQQLDQTYEDTDQNTFALHDFSTAMVSCCLMIAVKDGMTTRPTTVEE